MRKSLCILGFLLFTMSIFAQSKSHKFGILIGGGSQKYSGDLGNGFKLKNDTWYGSANIQMGLYLNKSFDAGVFGSTGDYGYCQPASKANELAPISDRCPGCVGRLTLGNLNSRLTTGGLFVKYKIANGYILKEESKIKPYVYFGAAVNTIKDIMKMNCINPGKYYSINGGAGLTYSLTDRIHVGYNLAFGQFTSDRLDFQIHGRRDLSMQNSITLGVNLF
jgi:hypothetical protein